MARQARSEKTTPIARKRRSSPAEDDQAPAAHQRAEILRRTPATPDAQASALLRADPNSRQDATQQLQNTQGNAYVQRVVQRAQVQRQPSNAGYKDTVVQMRWTEDEGDFFQALVAAVGHSAGFRGVPHSSLWQPLHDPAIDFYRRHEIQTKPGQLVRLSISGYYSPDNANYAPGLINVLLAFAAAPQPRQKKILHDKPSAVFEAIVNIMSAADLFGDVTPTGELHPQYYIDVKKTVTDPEYVGLLWEWFHITHERVTDKRNVTSIVEGSIARTRIAQATTAMAPLIERMAAEGGVSGALYRRYLAKVDQFTQRAAREEVNELIEGGKKKERATPPNEQQKAEEEQIKALAFTAEGLIDEAKEAIFRTSEKYTSHEAFERLHEMTHERFEEGMRQYLKEVFSGNVLASEPELQVIRPATRMNFGDGVAWLKGGLDAVSVVLTVTDPEKRKALLAAHEGFFGKVSAGTEISKLMLQFVSGVIGFGGAGVYSMARVLGKAELAEQVLAASTKGVAKVTGALYFVGVIHGTLTLLDPDASPDEKAEAAAEVASSSVGAAGFISDVTGWAPAVGRWAGPIGASLQVNWQLLKLAARGYKGAVIGLSRLDWVSAYQETVATIAAVEQESQRLGVTDALMAQESDGPRQSELQKSAGASRYVLIDQQIKPYLESRKRAGNDPYPTLMNRFLPISARLENDVKSDDEALQIASMFLLTAKTALADWDNIVLKPR